MVQRFPELQGIDLGLARTVSLIKFVQVFAGKHKGRNPFAVVSEPDLSQITAFAEEKRPSKNIRGLKTGCVQ